MYAIHTHLDHMSGFLFRAALGRNMIRNADADHGQVGPVSTKFRGSFLDSGILNCIFSGITLVELASLLAMRKGNPGLHPVWFW